MKYTTLGFQDCLLCFLFDLNVCWPLWKPALRNPPKLGDLAIPNMLLRLPTNKSVFRMRDVLDSCSMGHKQWLHATTPRVSTTSMITSHHDHLAAMLLAQRVHLSRTGLAELVRTSNRWLETLQIKPQIHSNLLSPVASGPLWIFSLFEMYSDKFQFPQSVWVGRQSPSSSHWSWASTASAIANQLQMMYVFRADHAPEWLMPEMFSWPCGTQIRRCTLLNRHFALLLAHALYFVTKKVNIHALVGQSFRLSFQQGLLCSEAVPQLLSTFTKGSQLCLKSSSLRLEIFARLRQTSLGMSQPLAAVPATLGCGSPSFASKAAALRVHRPWGEMFQRQGQ